MHRHFSFAIATLKVFQHPEYVKFQLFPLQGPNRNAISSKVFNEFSKTFFYLKNKERCLLWLKIWKVHKHFSFAIATLQVFQHPEHIKFQPFPLHCPSRNAMSSKALNEFSKTFFIRKIRNVAIRVENLKCTDILVLQ